MPERFIGKPDLLQVTQPEGSELCFAAVTASVVGVSIGEADAALQAAFVSEDDGSTPPFFNSRVELPVGDTGKNLVIDAVQGYDQEASDVEGVISNIDAKLRENTPVALLFNRTDDPETARMHWVLLTGYTYARDTDIVDGVSIMDPEREDKYLADPVEVVDMIDRSMGTTGVFAYALSVETPEEESGRLAFVADGEHEGFGFEGEAGRRILDAINEQRAALITRRGKIAAIVIPVTMSELMQKALAADSELAGQIAHAAERHGEGIPVAEAGLTPPEV